MEPPAGSNGVRGAAGLEATNVTHNGEKGLGNQPKPGAANALHFGPETPVIDPELARVFDAWPTLDDETKRAVLGLVETTAADAV